MSLTHVFAAGLCEVCGETAEWVAAGTWDHAVRGWLGSDNPYAYDFAAYLARGYGAFVEAMEDGGVSLPAEWEPFKEGLTY